MNGYPVVDELEVMVRAGRGAAIIVEGESAEKDPWFYGQWFGDLAREVTFFPQDGWTRVVEAVAELRRRCPDVPVYGIIDRDFADDAALDLDFASGILRTPSYTLENYLLDPACWAEVFRFIFRRQMETPAGWDQAALVHGYIEAAYRSCLDLAAHNWVIKYGWDHYPAQATASSEHQRTYREHSDALAGIEVADKLRTWGLQMGCAEDFGALFEDKRLSLLAGGPDSWAKHISGKYVLRVFHRAFPRRPGAGQFDLGHYLNEYLRACPNPPDDLSRLLERILIAAKP
jgi:hypothetical protein